MRNIDKAKKLGVVAILSVIASALCAFCYGYFELANHEVGSSIFLGIVLFPMIGFILGIYSIIIRLTWLGFIGLLLAIALIGGYLWVVANIEKGMKRQQQPRSKQVEWRKRIPDLAYEDVRWI